MELRFAIHGLLGMAESGIFKRIFPKRGALVVYFRENQIASPHLFSTAATTTTVAAGSTYIVKVARTTPVSWTPGSWLAD